MQHAAKFNMTDNQPPAAACNVSTFPRKIDLETETCAFNGRKYADYFKLIGRKDDKNINVKCSLSERGALFSYKFQNTSWYINSWQIGFVFTDWKAFPLLKEKFSHLAPRNPPPAVQSTEFEHWTQGGSRTWRMQSPPFTQKHPKHCVCSLS